MAARCFSLHLSGDELNCLAETVDGCLNVEQAIAEPNRQKSIALLAGDQIMRDTKYPDNVVKGREILLQSREPKKKSNWPVMPEGREKIKRRTAELRAKGIPSPYSGRVSASGKFYLPSNAQKRTLEKVKAQVSTLLDTMPDQLSKPQAMCSMIATEGPDRQLHTSKSVCVSISLHDATKPLDMFTSPPFASDLELDAGELLVVDAGIATREPHGDFRRTLNICKD